MCARSSFVLSIFFFLQNEFIIGIFFSLSGRSRQKDEDCVALSFSLVKLEFRLTKSPAKSVASGRLAIVAMMCTELRPGTN